MSGFQALMAAIPSPVAAVEAVAGDVRIRRGVASAINEIFVRPGGNDETGLGTLALPFASVQRGLDAFRRFPQRQGENVLDLTGMGVVNLSQSLHVPAVFSGQPPRSDPSPRYPEFTQLAPVTIRAQPTTMTSILAGAVVSDTADAATNTRTLTVSGTPFTPSAFVGKMLIGAGIGEFTKVIANTSNTITYQAFFAYTPTIRVCQASCTLRLNDEFSYDTTLVMRGVGCAVYLQGVDLEHANPDAFAYALELGDLPEVLISHSSVRGAIVHAGVSSGIFIGSQVLGGNWLVTGSAPSIFRCLFSGVTMLEHDAIGGVGQVYYLYSWFQGCSSIGHGGNNEAHSAYEMANCEVRNGTGNGVVYGGGARCSVRNSRVQGCVGDAIRASGPGRIDVVGVVGTGNGGAGVRLEADSGCRATVTASTTVAGASDILVGANAARTWTHFRGSAPVGREIDAADPSTRLTQP